MELPESAGRTADTYKLTHDMPSNNSPPELDRPGGYAVEPAIPFESIGRGFRPDAGRGLRLEIVVSDRDGDDNKATTCSLLLFGEGSQQEHRRLRRRHVRAIPLSGGHRRPTACGSSAPAADTR